MKGNGNDDRRNHVKHAHFNQHLLLDIVKQLGSLMMDIHHLLSLEIEAGETYERKKNSTIGLSAYG